MRPRSPSRNATVHVALGSNLGDRESELNRALELMDRTHHTRVKARSAVYETRPEGPSENLYYNMVAEIRTGLDPFALLDTLMDIEEKMGRVHAGVWSDRNIDLDIVLWGPNVVQTGRLTVPHPRMHTREFVLRPLCDIAPNATHPLFRKTMAELLALLGPPTARRISP